jgi:hypothetical protein
MFRRNGKSLRGSIAFRFRISRIYPSATTGVSTIFEKGFIDIQKIRRTLANAGVVQLAPSYSSFSSYSKGL